MVATKTVPQGEKATGPTGGRGGEEGRGLARVNVGSFLCMEGEEEEEEEEGEEGEEEEEEEEEVVVGGVVEGMTQARLPSPWTHISCGLGQPEESEGVEEREEREEHVLRALSSLQVDNRLGGRANIRTSFPQPRHTNHTTKQQTRVAKLRFKFVQLRWLITFDSKWRLR